MQIRASMYDYARGQCVLPETLEGIIERSAAFGLNAFVLYIEDIALFLRPELHKGTLTPDRLRELDRFAAEKGITLIPALAMCGHAKKSLQHEAFRELAEFDGADSFDIFNPRLMEVLRELLRVTAEIFSGPYIHIGCDEAWDVGKRNAPDASWPIVPFVEHVNKLSDATMALGRRPMFWGDMLSRFYPEHIPSLRRDLIPADWFYTLEKEYPTISWWGQHGFKDVVVCPAIGYHMNIFPRYRWPSSNIRNLIATGIEAGATGVILTAWEHLSVTRYAEREQMNYLGATLSAEGLNRTNEEILTDYHNQYTQLPAQEVLEYYAACDELVSLFPEGFNDLCSNPLERRESWLRNYEYASQSMLRLEELAEKIGHLADKIEPQSCSGEYSPFQVGALRATHAVSLLRLDAKDIATAGERVELLRDYSRREWENERVLVEPQYSVAVDDRYVKQLEMIGKAQSVAAVTSCPHMPPEAQASPGEFSHAPAIDGLTDRKRCIAETEKTQLWFAWNEADLKIRCRCSQGGAIRGAEDRTDLMLTRDDIVCFQIDSEHKHRESIWLECNPAGKVCAEIHSVDGKRLFDSRFPLRVEATASRVDDGWEFVLILPYSSLGAVKPEKGATWGLSVERRNCSTDQISFWGGDPIASRSAPAALGHLVFE